MEHVVGASSSQTKYFAHSITGRGTRAWEPLAQHLAWVACGPDGGSGSRAFASKFGVPAWGELLGWWHDLGKYSDAFQQYLKASSDEEQGDPHRLDLRGTVDHSTTGAVHAYRKDAARGCLLAYCIAGHHAGLPNWTALPGESGGSSLSSRLAKPPLEATSALQNAPASLLDQPLPPMPLLTLARGDVRRQAFQLAFMVRMLFSCLVDADFLATEAFMDPARAAVRPGTCPTMAELAQKLAQHIAMVSCRRGPNAVVARHRAMVLDACLAAAQREPGLFALTVPTGGGKTLSSMAFALNHAARHSLDRVIVAIPFTSIIEQNAAVYRTALGLDAVLEHHSNLDVRRADEQSVRDRLAAENWDAPVVVTTNVQLLESLFAARPSRCRKLHNIVRSVIVLDEAQALPPNLLAPTLAALHELVTNYGCSIVLCTATQPALEQRSEFPIGLPDPHQIVPAERREELFTALRRVEVEQVGALDDAAVVERLAKHEQVLCVVNTRVHASTLFTSLRHRLEEAVAMHRSGHEIPRAGTCLHLSASMCARHRTALLRVIRRRLARGLPCRVISTQLVEAGVDIDFPVVFRALAGLDSIAQAAGRCNREGKLSVPGRVLVFEPTNAKPPPFLRSAINATAQVLPDHADLLSPAAQHDYFRLHYWDEGQRSGWDRPAGQGADASKVLDCFGDGGALLQFRQAEQLYQLIPDGQHPVFVPYGRVSVRLKRQLLGMPEPPRRGFDRQLQRLVVNLFEHQVQSLHENTLLYPVDRTYGRLVLSNPNAYDRLVGLRLDTAGWDPDELVA